MPHTYDYTQGRIHPILLQFVYGLRGPRKNDVTLKQIKGYFVGTPAAHVQQELEKLIDGGHVDIRRTGIGRRHKTGYVYCLTEKGMAYFESYVRDGACHTG